MRFRLSLNPVHKAMRLKKTQGLVQKYWNYFGTKKLLVLKIDIKVTWDEVLLWFGDMCSEWGVQCVSVCAKCTQLVLSLIKLGVNSSRFYRKSGISSQFEGHMKEICLRKKKKVRKCLSSTLSKKWYVKNYLKQFWRKKVRKFLRYLRRYLKQKNTVLKQLFNLKQFLTFYHFLIFSSSPFTTVTVTNFFKFLKYGKDK